MNIIDVHAHHFFYKNLDEVMKENKRKGVKIIIENGLNPITNRKVIEESKKYDIVKASLGFHPTDIVKSNDNVIEKEIEFIKKNKDKIVAIGEVGLDFYWIKDENLVKKEIYWFEKFLELAEEIKKPVIIHSREAEKECIETLKSYNLKVILHSFWKLSLVKEAVHNDFYISIPAFVYKNKELQKIAEETPLDLLLTETDSPFLDPIEKRNNRSWKIIYGLQKIAEIKKIEIKEIMELIEKNFKKIFIA